MTYDEARAQLVAWRDDYPSDPFSSDAMLRRLLARYLEGPRLADLERRASAFGVAMTTVVGPAAARYEQRAHLPEFAPYDGIGRRVERVDFDPSYHAAGEAVWASGVVAFSGEPGRAFEQATLLYLLSLEGEAGHACPATCTIGLARALRRRAEPRVADRFLPALLEADYASAERGAQFLTEVQGGSDVGANACLAEPSGDGETYRITGEKWFCSVADADQFFVTARVPGGPAGTAGLASFVVPRELDGRPNGFTLRRLKDKLGTRGLASGEIDFLGAVAWPIGPLEEGFKTAVGVVLNTSRWMTAVGAAGIMRRAVLEARAFARHREAFGQPIERFAAVATTVAQMLVTADGALALVMALTELEDRIDAARASELDVHWHRLLVNLVKYLTSRQATSVARDGIEVLGGNGTIEEFSVLPRLYRDAIVYESWEGTHNVLAAQVLNDLRRLPLLEAASARLGALVGGVEGLATGLEDALAGLERCRSDDEFAAWHLRGYLDRLGLVAEAAYLAEVGEVAGAQHLYAINAPGYDAGRDDGLARRVAAVLGH